jgi:DNA invertase Pin-like site-specific DNA recombinase
MAQITKLEAVKTGKIKLRVAAYARVSTGSDDQLISLETQKRHYEAYIKARRDWEFAGLYYDEGISGTKTAKREGLLRMIKDCENGLIDYILVKSISRFSRNTVDSVGIVRKLKELGIYIYFEKENIDTGKMEGELMLSILSSLAQSESRSISTNAQWSILRRFTDGTYISYPPYGYKNVDRKMVPVSDQARVVRRIFDGILNGKSAADIAEELNEKGIPTKNGCRWRNASIRDVIRNKTYTGSLVLQKTYTDEFYNRHMNYGEKDMYRVNDHHEPIVSQEIFDAANRIMSENGAEKGNVRGRGQTQKRYPMSGKVICGECGSKWKRIGLSYGMALSCTRHLADKRLCSQKAIKVEAVEAAFSTMLNKLTFARNLILIPYRRMLTGGYSRTSKGRLPEIDELLAKNEARRKQIASFFSQKLLDSETFGRENAELLKEKNRLLEEKKAFDSGSAYDRVEELEKLLRYTGKGRTVTEFDGDLFTEFVDKVIVYKRTEIGFVMKCGPTFREVIR